MVGPPADLSFHISDILHLVIQQAAPFVPDAEPVPPNMAPPPPAGVAAAAVPEDGGPGPEGA